MCVTPDSLPLFNSQRVQLCSSLATASWHDPLGSPSAHPRGTSCYWKAQCSLTSRKKTNLTVAMPPSRNSISQVHTCTVCIAQQVYMYGHTRMCTCTWGPTSLIALYTLFTCTCIYMYNTRQDAVCCALEMAVLYHWCSHTCTCTPKGSFFSTALGDKLCCVALPFFLSISCTCTCTCMIKYIVNFIKTQKNIWIL